MFPNLGLITGLTDVEGGVKEAAFLFFLLKRNHGVAKDIQGVGQARAITSVEWRHSEFMVSALFRHC